MSDNAAAWPGIALLWEGADGGIRLDSAEARETAAALVALADQSDRWVQS